MILNDESSLSIDIDDRGGSGHQLILSREKGEVRLLNEDNQLFFIPQHIFDDLVMRYYDEGIN